MALYEIEDLFEEGYTLILSGRRFNKGVIISWQASEKPQFKELLIIVNLECNPDFPDVDLKDSVLLIDSNNDVIFRGIAKEAYIEKEKAKLVVLDEVLELNYVSSEGFYLEGLSARDSFSLLLQSSEKVKLGAVDGFFDSTFREFIVITPVENLIIGNSFKIGNVEFYTDFTTIDDSLIRSNDIGKSISDWNDNYTRARITVKASSFLSAMREGYSKIATAIDLVALRVDLSFPKIRINGDYEYIHFDYEMFLSRVKITPWIYLRDTHAKSHVIFNQEFVKENDLLLGCRPSDHFKIINSLFERILIKEDLNKNEKNVLQVLHWLRRAIQGGDNTDKLLDLWTAMEFLISGTKSTRLFCKPQLKEIRSTLESVTDLTPKQQKVLFGKIDELNKVPLMVKIAELEEELGISFAEEEKDILRNTRKKRNDIIHGRECEDVHERELNKLRSIIERLLIGIIIKTEE